jgi:hypothetical protein
MVALHINRGVGYMTDTQPLTRPRPGARLLITSSALLAAAGAFGIAGLGIATIALVAITRRRIDRMEVPPRELARRNLRRARAAVNAGAGAWQNRGTTLSLRVDDTGIPVPASDSREPASSF